MNKIFSRYFFCPKHPEHLYSTAEQNGEKCVPKQCPFCNSTQEIFVTPCCHCGELFTISQISEHEEKLCSLFFIHPKKPPKRLLITICVDETQELTVCFFTALLQAYKTNVFYATLFSYNENERFLQQRLNSSCFSCGLKNVVDEIPDWFKVDSFKEYQMMFVCSPKNFEQCMKIANAIKFTPKLNLQERSKIIFSVDEADTNFPIFNKIDNVIICKGSTHKKMRTLTFSVLAELLRMKETDENGMYQFMLNQMRTYAQSMKNSAKIKTSINIIGSKI
jgi:hypothetical protein